MSQSDPDASQEAAPKATPCEQDARFREFDFWVGEWEVHDTNGTLVGENSIRREERGCVLTENWSGAKGSTGMSINYLDKVTDEWVQSWHAAGGYQIIIRGGLTDEGMLLSGTIHYIANGRTAPFRGLWTPMPDGRVRQYFEQSNDDGATWEPWFEGFYSRKPSD
jgi:hypothetical protein